MPGKAINPPFQLRPRRLEAQDTALSRQQQGFESPWGRSMSVMAHRASWVVEAKCANCDAVHSIFECIALGFQGRGAPSEC